MKPWEDMTELEQLQCEYSDFYKDVHGVRPKFYTEDQINSIEWIKEQMNVLISLEV